MYTPHFIRRRRGLKPVQFVSGGEVFKPQVQVKILRDLSGWVNRDRKIKWELKAGELVYLDEDTAAEFIVKGYAAGELPRPVSANEAANWRNQMTTVSLEVPNG